MYPRISLNGVYDRDAPLEDDLALCLNSSVVQVSTLCHPNLLSLDDQSRWPKQLASARRTSPRTTARAGPLPATTSRLAC